MSQERIFLFHRDIFPEDVAGMVHVARTHPNLKVYRHEPSWDPHESVAYVFAESPEEAAAIWCDEHDEEQPVKPDEFEECV